jgi:hypothetical protein
MRTQISISLTSSGRKVILLLCFVAPATWSPVAKAQQKGSSTDAYVGILVTATAGEAESVLKQLHAGMDFGILARENPSTQLPATADTWDG